MLPDNPNLSWLRKQAKRHLDELRRTNPAAQLADAQFGIAKQYGFPSWRSLKAHIDSMSIEGQVFEAARTGDVARLAALLDTYPDTLHGRSKAYEWTLLHAAASEGRLEAVDLLLARGLDVNSREKGDNTYAMHWAAAGGHVDVVRRLFEAGGDVIGKGDDHQLEVIGWATCWEGQDDEAHRAVVDVLLRGGARHHIFSAIALELSAVVRRIVADDPSAINRRMSRNENHQLPLHFAIRMRRPAMVSLLLELGADPLAVDGSGQPAALYATSRDVDTTLMQAIRTMTASEMVSAERGHRPPRIGMLDLAAVLSLRDTATADRLLRESPAGIQPGTLHLMAKRNDVDAVMWLLAHGADPNAKWAHRDSEVTPLHLAASQGHAEVVRLLLAAGADPGIRDSKHDSDVRGWAEFFKKPEIVEILEGQART